MVSDSSAGSVHRQPAIFLPHGGGPCFFMDWPTGRDPWLRMGDFLRHLLQSLPERPKAILVVSGHWEEGAFTVNSGESPPLLFDYYGFPAHTYQLRYPAPGAPGLARRVRQLLGDAGLPSQENDSRGFDHGVFVPFLLVDPDARIPVLQVSLQQEPGSRTAHRRRSGAGGAARRRRAYRRQWHELSQHARIRRGVRGGIRAVRQLVERCGLRTGPAAARGGIGPVGPGAGCASLSSARRTPAAADGGRRSRCRRSGAADFPGPDTERHRLGLPVRLRPSSVFRYSFFRFFNLSSSTSLLLQFCFFN